MASGLLEGLARVHLTVKGTEQAARAGEGHNDTSPGYAASAISWGARVVGPTPGQQG
jgi:hypothetical protein